MPAEAEKFETITVHSTDGVLTVTLERPERKNTLTLEVYGELSAVLHHANTDPRTRVIVITGSGDFCAGADLADGVPPDLHPLETMRRVNEIAHLLYHTPKPTIAKVRGAAVGAGCNLALACDLICASADARFSQIFARRGLSIDFGGSWILPRLVGLHQAKEMALLAEIMTAEEARQFGMINRVVPADEIDAVVDGWAQRLAAGPPMALWQTKQLLNNSFESTVDQALDAEARAQVANFATTDVAEGFSSFHDKRTPQFTGNSSLDLRF